MSIPSKISIVSQWQIRLKHDSICNTANWIEPWKLHGMCIWCKLVSAENTQTEGIADEVFQSAVSDTCWIYAINGVFDVVDNACFQVLVFFKQNIGF